VRPQDGTADLSGQARLLQAAEDVRHEKCSDALHYLLIEGIDHGDI
jgi:hypothetical protein